MDIQPGDCVQMTDGRIARVREDHGTTAWVRVRRRTSKTQQMLEISKGELTRVPCPQGWMSPEGYNRYLRVTLEKMRLREKQKTEKSAS